MGRATIIEDKGSGLYSIKRNWAGRDGINNRISILNSQIAEMQAELLGMPEDTQEKIFEKHILKLQILALQKKVIYLQDHMPNDATVDAWCADYTEGLTGEVGTIDIAGEYTADVNIRPNGIESNAHNLERDGDLYPAIALLPWTSLLDLMIYPGWQKFKPLHRYGVIIDGTIDYDANTCVIAVKPTYSLLNYNVNMSATGTGDKDPAATDTVSYSKTLNMNVNQGDTLGREEIEFIRYGFEVKGYARDFFIQNDLMVHPGFLDFIQRNPDHPISQVSYTSDPIYMTDEQYEQVTRICRTINHFEYKNDMSGYGIGDYWNVMADLGDTWYWVPSTPNIGSQNWHNRSEEWKIANPREKQSEFFIGSKALSYDDSGQIIGFPLPTDYDDVDYYVNRKIGYSYMVGGFLTGKYSQINLRLEFEALRQNFIKIPQVRKGDCEDFALTKMQAIIEASILPANSMQIVLCYVIGAGYHAVLGIQTANKGFLISDSIEPSQLWEIEQLSNTHQWGNFSIATNASGDSPVKWADPQVILKDVPIEYMSCNAAAFQDGDEVIVEFENQDWKQPKVIGFRDEPIDCIVKGFYTFGENPGTSTTQFAYRYTLASDSWKTAGELLPSWDMNRSRTKATKNDILYLITGGATRGDDYPGVHPWPSICVIYNSGDCAGQDHYTNAWNVWQGRRDTIIFNGMLEVYNTLTDYPSPYRAKHSGWFINDRHYICGGTSYPSGYLDIGDYYNIDHQMHDVHNDLDEYNETTDVWKNRTDMPRNLHQMADFAVSTLGFVAGGNTKTYAYFPPLYWEYGEDDVRRYSAIMDTWASMQSLPRWRFDCAGFEANGKGYVVRGHESTGIIIDPPVEQIDIYPSDKPLEYDVNADTWTYKQEHPARAWHQHIRGHCAAGYGDKGYSVSEDDGHGANHNQEYNPTTDTWIIKTDRPGGRVDNLSAA